MRMFLFAIVLLSPGIGVAQPAKNARSSDSVTFHLHLMEMAKHFPGKSDAFRSFSRLRAESIESADFLAQFWMAKAESEHRHALAKARTAAGKDPTIRPSTVQAVRAMHEATKSIYIGYYFDNWDRVKSTIDGRLETAVMETAIRKPPGTSFSNSPTSE